MTIEQRAMQWIVGPHVGVSSKTIWSVMQGVKPDSASVPHDPDDFSRCHRLLTLIPEWRMSLELVAREYPEWTALVREWGRLTEMFERVIGEDGKGWNMAAGRTMYDAMKLLIDEGRIAAGWKQTGPGSWRKGKAQTVELGNGVSFSIDDSRVTR
jgi:hypothetical protein